MSSTSSLSDATAKVLRFKPGIVRNVAVAIMQKLMETTHTPGYFSTVWPDDIDQTDIAEVDKNAIGIAFRQLARAGLIEDTGEFRKSRTKSARGRRIFEKRLVSTGMSVRFLLDNRPTQERPQQQELTLP